jgi:hypothetical protein
MTHAAVRLRIVELLNAETIPYDVAASAMLATASIAADKAMDVVESVATMYKHLGAEKIKSLLGNPPVSPPEQAKPEPEPPPEPQRPPTQYEQTISQSNAWRAESGMIGLKAIRPGEPSRVDLSQHWATQPGVAERLTTHPAELNWVAMQAQQAAAAQYRGDGSRGAEGDISAWSQSSGTPGWALTRPPRPAK